MKGTATLIGPAKGTFTGEAKHYKLDPPLKDSEYGSDPGAEYEYVVVSATIAPFSGAETYIFPSDETGEVTGWGELPGSYRGGLSHTGALSDAGYRVVGHAD